MSRSQRDRRGFKSRFSLFIIFIECDNINTATGAKIMAYECQSCYSRFEDEEISGNSLGEPQCPECGSIELEPIDTNNFFEDRLEDQLNEDLDESDSDIMFNPEG
jgi:NAD-dependent SIR2 family protein deacetylase